MKFLLASWLLLTIAFGALGGYEPGPAVPGGDSVRIMDGGSSFPPNP